MTTIAGKMSSSTGSEDELFFASEGLSHVTSFACTSKPPIDLPIAKPGIAVCSSGLGKKVRKEQKRQAASGLRVRVRVQVRLRVRLQLRFRVESRLHK